MSRRKRPPRVVIDTNLVLSALVFSGGQLQALRQAWQSGVCVPLVCKYSASELLRVLNYPKFKLTVSEQHELLNDYLPFCETFTLPIKTPKSIHCRDAHDIPFLHLALIGKADCLISGDQDLLVMANDFACPIVSAKEFTTRFLS